VRPIVILDTNILLDILVFDDQRAHPLRTALTDKKLMQLLPRKLLKNLLTLLGALNSN